MDFEKINELSENIILKIKEKRKSLGLSHENMAEELQISVSAYNKIERQETKLTVERLLQIQQILDFSISEIFNLKSENIYNQDLKDNSIGHQEVQNLYHDNRALTDKFIENLQAEVKYLRDLLAKK